LFIQSITVAPTGLIFAGGGHDVYRSTDNGSSWSLVFSANSVAVQAVAAGLGELVFAGTSGYGIYRSTDSGNTWTQTSSGGSIASILIHQSGKIFAGNNSGDIICSTDSGNTWTPVLLTPSTVAFNSIVECPEERIFAGLGGVDLGAHGAIFRSTDGGVTWTMLTDVWYPVTSLAVDSNDFIYAGTSDHPSAGLFRSTDYGDGWELTAFPAQVLSIAVDSGDALLVGSGTNDGLFRSSDGANTWTQVNTGLTNTTVRSLGAGMNENLVAGMFGGIWHSSSSGGSWEKVQELKGYYASVYSIRASPWGHLFAGVSGDNGRVYRSTDGGATWAQTDSGLPDRTVCDLAFEASGHILAGMSYPAGVYRSTDNGDSWLPSGLQNTSVSFLAASPTGDIFAANYTDVYKSTDNGYTWVQPNFPTYGIEALAVGLNGFVYVGLNGAGIYRSTDEGDSWWQTPLPHSFVNAIAINPSGNLFVGTYDGVYQSTDDGVSWSQINGGLTHTSVMSLALTPDGYIFAGTWGGGVYGSVEPTTSAERKDDGLPTEFKLFQNYPNPFNPSTTIRYQLPQEAFVTLKLYNILGQEVAALVDEEKDAGSYQVQFDGRVFSSGVYFYRLRAGEFVETKKLLLLK
jgi:photosystem II stability/assembly factor-like uncharacterized protein